MKKIPSLFFTNRSVHRLPVTVLIFGVLVAQVTAHPLRRIRFKPGATKAAVVGRLRGQNDFFTMCCAFAPPSTCTSPWRVRN
jgi:hypothetical protein